MRAPAQGMGIERRARCLRGNMRVRSAPFALAKIFNMRHDRPTFLSGKGVWYAVSVRMQLPPVTHAKKED